MEKIVYEKFTINLSFPFFLMSLCILFNLPHCTSVNHHKIIKQQYRGFSPGTPIST